MNTLLSIDQATCIKCGKCVKVCPSLIFTQATKGGEVIPEHIDDCIQCGHCVAVCP
ncbi:MAG: 4Fe-4S dicluster domain-containing protein, partial [Tannerellaceae bacterium]